MSNPDVKMAEGLVAEFNVASEISVPQLQGQSNNGTKPSQYWAQPETGWICIQPSWPTEAAYLYERGFRSLKDRFGVFFKKNDDGWDSILEPWRRIFQRNGADVFPVSQVLEHGWHRKPPYEGVTFPQLRELEPDEKGRRWEILVGEMAGTIHQDARCSQCGKFYLSDMNLRNHENIAHRETSANNALGRAIATAQVDAVAAGTGAMGGQLGEALAKMAEVQAAQTKALIALTEQMAELKAGASKKAG